MDGNHVFAGPFIGPPLDGAAEAGAIRQPFDVVRPARRTSPALFASPHSGRIYPPQFLASSRLDATTIRQSEDAFVDWLFASAPAAGAPLLKALFPRAYVDPNREAFELDPGMFKDALPACARTDTRSVAVGLGTIPKIVSSGGEIRAHKMSFQQALAMIEQCYEPYHAALGNLIAETTARFGACLLLDCHSMPSRAGGGGLADIVLGDCHGTTAAPAVLGRIEQAFRGAGFKVKRNRPYAGGYTTQHYANPAAGIHTVQIEINRGLYMDETNVRPLPAISALRQRLDTVIGPIAAIDAAALRPRAPIASPMGART